MIDGIEGIVRHLVEAADSPWAYLVLFVFSALDGFFPVVPSESLVITGGVFAASGGPILPLVILASAAGAFTGDHISYFIGRRAGHRFTERAATDSRSGRSFAWAARTLEERGGLVLVVARYVPGGRTAITLTMGAVGYPRPRFTLFDALAASSWAIYSAMIGYIGGEAFEENPAKGLLAGFGVAIAITVCVETIRYLRHHLKSSDDPSPTPARSDHSTDSR